MRGSDSCSNSGMLERFVLGVLPADDLIRLGQHVEQCALCVNTLDGLRGEDTLVADMRGAPEAAALVEAVIGRDLQTCCAAELVPVLEQLLVLVQLRSKQPHARQTCDA